MKATVLNRYMAYPTKIFKKDASDNNREIIEVRKGASLIWPASSTAVVQAAALVGSENDATASDTELV